MKIDSKKILLEIETSFTNAKKIIWIIGRHAFAVIIILVLIDVFWGGFLYYKYVYLAEREDAKINTAHFKFNENIYQEILSQWQKRDKSRQQFLQKDYKSPF